MPAWEYCELKFVKIRGVIKEVKQWQAHKSTVSGSTIVIAKSEEVTLGLSQKKTHEMIEKGYQQLVAQLTSAGWEPAATWGSEIRSMKKQVDGDGGATDSTNPTGLLKQLANLRDAGMSVTGVKVQKTTE
jgi:hypothetical protein